MVDLGVLQEKGTPACWLAPMAALGPANAQASYGHPLGTSYVEGHQRPVGVYFRAGPIGVEPLEAIPTIGDDGPGELVGAVLDGEGGGGRTMRSHIEPLRSPSTKVSERPQRSLSLLS